MNNIYEELLETQQSIKSLYERSQEIKANISLKYLKHKLTEYLNDYRVIN